MKRLSAILLSAMLLFSMAACGRSEEYIPSADITVALTHVADKAKVVTRRTSDWELSDVELICVYFDAQGQQLGKYERVKCSFTTKGEVSIWTFAAPEGCAYMDAAVAAVTYADGTENICPGATTWAKKTAQAFTPANYEKQAAAAEKCDAVEYSVDPAQENGLSLKLKNISGKEITEVIACLLWFDENGSPIDMDGMLVDNSERVSAKELDPDKESAYIVDKPEDAATARVIIQEVVFADGSVWKNDYVYEWSVENWDSAK